MKTEREIIRAAMKLATSFDGRVVRYAKDRKRVFLLRRQVNEGPAQDALAFEKDLSVALGNFARGRAKIGKTKSSVSGDKSRGSDRIVRP